MENITLQKRKVFVSYCHKDIIDDWLDKFVIALASFGIECVVDIYDLKLGNDLTYFMEKIKSDEIDKVLMLSGKTYQEKADCRDGGVGTETQIISSDVYADAEQERFIPICIDKDENGNARMPLYLKTRFYVDMSDDNDFAENIELIARSVHKIANHTKPVISEPPEILLQSGINSNKIFGFTMTNPRSLIEFFTAYISILDDCNFMQSADIPDDETIWNKIKDTKGIRDIYVTVLDKWLKNGNDIEPHEIINFFEQFYDKSRSSSNEVLQFLLMEIIIYTVMLLYRYFKLFTIYQIINTTYFPKYTLTYGKNGITIDDMYTYIGSFEKRKRRLNLNRVSLQADLLVERAEIKNLYISKDNLIEADVLFSVLCEWFFLREDRQYSYWCPVTCIYDEYRRNYTFALNLISRSRFKNIKQLFGVETEEEFIERYEEIAPIIANANRRLGTFSVVPAITTLIKKEELFSKA